MKSLIVNILLLMVFDSAFAANPIRTCEPTYRGNPFKYVSIEDAYSNGVCAYDRAPFGDGYSIGPVKSYEEVPYKIWDNSRRGKYTCYGSAEMCAWLSLK